MTLPPEVGTPMVASDNVFAGSIPALYPRLMVPMLFEGYADDLAARSRGPRGGARARDRCGNGGRDPAARGEHAIRARLIVTDLNSAMLARPETRRARTIGSRGGRPSAGAAVHAAAFDVVCTSSG